MLPINLSEFLQMRLGNSKQPFLLATENIRLPHLSQPSFISFFPSTMSPEYIYPDMLVCPDHVVLTLWATMCYSQC